MYKTLFTIFGFLFGIGIGSFLGAVVWRIKEKKNIVKGRSQCPECGAELKWHDLIPLFSFLFQRWKCKYCKKPIKPYYFFIELITGLVTAGIVYAFTDWILLGNGADFLAFEWMLFVLFGLSTLTVCATFILLAFYDLLYKEVPSTPLWVAAGSAIAASVLELWFCTLGCDASLPLAFPADVNLSYFSVSFSPTLLLVHKLLGALFLFAFFFLVNRATKNKGMGWGDVLFAPIPGFLVGFLPGFVALISSFIIGSVISSIWAMLKFKKIKGVEVPYLPFFVLTLLVVILFQPAIMKLVINYVFGL